MSAVVVFLGPTLPGEDAAAILPGAAIRPPAAQGDVVEAVQEGAAAIVIIDGAFESVPAVWHKDILWALWRGAAVYGGASMGALRAAEMAPFGMVGIGQIFDDIRAGRIVDDDEVAVRCFETNGRWHTASTALADLRHSLALAVADGVLTAGVAAEVVGALERTYYVDRTPDLVLSLTRTAGLEGSGEERLRGLLGPDHSLKAQDARAVLRRVAEDRRSKRWPQVEVFQPAWTNIWLTGSTRR